MNVLYWVFVKIYEVDSKKQIITLSVQSIALQVPSGHGDIKGGKVEFSNFIKDDTYFGQFIFRRIFILDVGSTKYHIIK